MIDCWLAISLCDVLFNGNMTPLLSTIFSWSFGSVLGAAHFIAVCKELIKVFVRIEWNTRPKPNSAQAFNFLVWLRPQVSDKPAGGFFYAHHLLQQSDKLHLCKTIHHKTNSTACWTMHQAQHRISRKTMVYPACWTMNPPRQIKHMASTV